MKRVLAAAIAALGLVLVTNDFADAAAARGGGGGGGFRGGEGFRGGDGFRGGGFRGGFDRGGFRGRVFVGGFGFYDPFWWPWYDPWFYPYVPPEVIVQYAPPAGYLPPPTGAAAQQYWYRCGNPEGYYPYVRQCSTGWEQVPVSPQGTSPAPPPP